MQSIRNSLALAILCLLALLSACSSNSSSPDAPDPQPSDDLVTIKGDVRVLGESARESLQSFDLDLDSGAGTLRFEAGDAQVAGFDVGQILATEPVNGVAPHGFLQRIVEKREEGEELVFVTEQANLEDVFEEAVIDYDQTLTEADLVSTTTLYEGVSFAFPDVAHTNALQGEKSGRYNFNVNFDKVLIDRDGDPKTTNDQLRLDGSFSFNLKAEAHIDIGVTGLKRFKFLLHVDDHADIKLQGDVKGKLDQAEVFARFGFDHIVVMVGVIPVVFNIDLELSLGAEGVTVNADRVVVRGSQSGKIKLGGQTLDGEKWEDLSSFDIDFDLPKPQISAELEARAYIKPQTGIRIYGLAGPYVFAVPFLEATAELKRAPFWQIDGGLDVGMGFMVTLPLIGKIADFSESYEAFRMTLDRSPNEKPHLEVLSPEDGVRLEDGETLSFRVRAKDREQAEVDIVLSEGGEEIARATVAEGKVETLVTEPLCQGSYEFHVTAVDSEGETDELKYSAIVENYKPRVSLDDDHLDELSLFPGSYLVAFANASDQSCSEPGNTAEQDLIEWYLNGNKISYTGAELIHRLPTGANEVGKTYQLEARYNDGIDIGISNPAEFTIEPRPAGVDLPPTAIIQYPKPTTSGNCRMHYNIPIAISGIGIDPEDGKLPASSLEWEFEFRGAGGKKFTLPGDATHVTLDEIGTWDIRLTVRDSADQTDTASISYCVRPVN